MRALLDINVLIALAWPNHVHHGQAQHWFTGAAADGWATCPLTQSGFVRVSSNPAVPHAVSPPAAAELLRRLVDIGDHVFFEDDISIVEAPEVDRARIASHSQVTDAHVLAIARRHGGRLATFDPGIQRSLSRGDRDPTIALITGEAIPPPG